MRTVWRIFSRSSARAGAETVPRWVGVLAVFVATLLGFETQAFGCLTDLGCSGSTPICDTVTMMCKACASDLECIALLSGTICVTTGPLQGQCVLNDAGADAGDASNSDAAADSGQDGSGGGTDAGADVEPDAGEAEGGSDASSGGPEGGSESGADAGADSPGPSEQDAQDGSSNSTPEAEAGNDGAGESGVDGAGNVESSADSATDVSLSSGDTGTREGGQDDSAVTDSTAREMSESGVSGDGSPMAEDSSADDTDPILEGGGCACRASPTPTPPSVLLVALLGPALWVRRRWRP